METAKIGVDIVSDQGLPEYSTVLISREGWETAIETLIERSDKLATTNRDLAMELRELASMLEIKSGLKD